MRVAFLTPSLSRTAGGIFEIERRLGQSLAELPGTEVKVYGAEDKFTAMDMSLWKPLKPKAYPCWGPDNFRYSPGLRRAFLNCDADIGHLHALWMHTSLIMLAWSRRHAKPYMITANGMLESWALKNARIKKRIVGALYERRCLEGAACIQVNSQREIESVRDFGLLNPISVIPNGVDVPAPPVSDRAVWNSSVPPGSKVLLYLGRLHPKKNLVTLLRAWHRTNEHPLSNQWYLVIAGWEQLGHASHLTRLATKLAAQRVLFVGPQFGDEKTVAFHFASAIVLPSLSEGLPMTVLEAWGAAKPVLMTVECNLPEGFIESAALRIEPDEGGIAAGLKKLFEMSGTDRQRMGENGLALVRRKFTWPIVARQLRAVYEWLIAGGSPPGCVVAE